MFIKWFLIGKRKPGPYPQIFVTEMADLAADWQFRIAIESLCFLITAYSKVSNIIVLFLHGMDVDLKSTLSADNYPPSKVVLIKVTESFLSIASFVTKRESEYHEITIDQSSEGFNAHFGPEHASSISGVVIPALSYKQMHRLD